MDSAITKTFFNRSAIPSNLLTVPEWNKFAKALGKPSWQSAVKYYADQRGGALVLKADGSLLVFTKRGEKLSQRTYRQNKWAWETRPF